jgi:molybdate transport system substrate-binding protein
MQTSPVSAPLTGISSMATRQVLAELVGTWGRPVTVESVGGVDAAKRVQSGETFDVVVLASTAIDKLIADGYLQRGRVDIVRSGVAVAVRAGAARPDIATEEALRRAVEAARSISYSTGPSGVHLARLFERWGIAAQIKDRIVEAPPGVPVGTLVARGEVDLGFQQLSELMHLDGIDVLGSLPQAVQVLTTFSGGVGVRSANDLAARDLLAHLASPSAADVKRRHGMEPA